MDKEEKIRIGKSAELILGDTQVIECFDYLGNEWMKESYTAGSVQEREKARDRLMALDCIRQRLQQVVANGKQAQRDLAKK